MAYQPETPALFGPVPRILRSCFMYVSLCARGAPSARRQCSEKHLSPGYALRDGARLQPLPYRSTSARTIVHFEIQDESIETMPITTILSGSVINRCAMQKISFADATTVKATSSHTYTAYFPVDWCIGSVPHGGFVTSVFLSVVKTHFSTTLKKQNQPHTIALGLNFLRRTEVGEALFTVREVKLGRQTSVVHVTLSQNIDNHTREEVVGYFTQSNLDTEKGVTFETGWSLDGQPPPVDLHLLKNGQDKNWSRAPPSPFAAFRKASQQAAFHLPRQGQSLLGCIDSWNTFNTVAPEKFTNTTLGFLSDVWLQQPLETMLKDEDSKKTFWYPTVLLNLDIKKALPEEGVEWLFVRVRAKKVKNGRYDLEIIIMDEDGDIVALSNHVVLALDASRNLAKRTRGDHEQTDSKPML
jgi:hypothetical protein